MSCTPRVVVVGAGIAGLSAANLLHKTGQFEVCVLEASGRLGGRIHTGKIGESTVEFGASWIHGTVGNPIFDLARELNILQESDADMQFANDCRTKPRFVTHYGKHVDDTLVTEIWHVYYNLITDAEDVKKMKKFVEGEVERSRMTVSDFLRQGFERYMESCTSNSNEVKHTKRMLFAFLEERECEICGCNSLHDLNLKEFGEYVSLEGPEACPVPCGFDSIVKSLATGLRSDCILYNHEVSQINWTGSSSEIIRGKRPVKVLCSNGEVFEADHVILTVSLGVLKYKYSTLFSPTLPLDKTEAIRNLGFGTVGKIFLEFEEPFWSSDQYGLNLAWEKMDSEQNKQIGGTGKNLGSEADGSMKRVSQPGWVERLFCFYTAHPGSKVLLGWFHGDMSPQIEGASAEKVGQHCLATIETFAAVKPLSRLMSVHRTQWGTSPWTRGSYSFLSKEAKGSNFDVLAAPLPYESGRERIPGLQVMFAGEATHRQFYSTVHGAYLSGVREAERLLNNLDSKREMQM